MRPECTAALCCPHRPRSRIPGVGKRLTAKCGFSATSYTDDNLCLRAAEVYELFFVASALLIVRPSVGFCLLVSQYYF